jgi:mono/diheme cytochrome c family protein
MRRTTFAAPIAGTMGMLMAVFAAGGASLGAETTPPRKAQVERGRYLVAIAACHDCHSPKVDAQMTPDERRLLSGRPSTTFPPMQDSREIRASLDLTAWAGPWGNSYAANLTPDAETGIGGRYTEASFVTTIRTGRKPEGETLSPPMPWTVYRNMTDDDLKAIYAYLMSLKPVRNAVRASPTPVLTRR